MTEQDTTIPEPESEATTGDAPPVEEGKFDSPTSNDVGEQTKTKADLADEKGEEGEESADTGEAEETQ